MTDGWLRGWAIPRRVLATSAVVVGALLVPLIAGYLLAGATAALAIGMGYLAGSRPAVSQPPRQALALAVPTALAAAVAVSLRGQPVPAACFVALSCLAVAPASRLQDGLLAGLPTMVAVLVAVPGDFDPAATAGWVLLGGAALVAVALHFDRPAAPAVGLRSRQAWRHAVVMATAVGVVVYLVARFEVPHGYWLALTLTAVLGPTEGGTRRKARLRVAGTVGGVLLALALAQTLPVWAVVVAVAGCGVFAVGYAVLGDYAREVVFLTPAVVLLAPPGSHGLFAAERAAATILGAVLAVVLALALDEVDERTAPDAATGETPSSEPGRGAVE